jgi:hypothetical protein
MNAQVQFLATAVTDIASTSVSRFSRCPISVEVKTPHGLNPWPFFALFFALSMLLVSNSSIQTNTLVGTSHGVQELNVYQKEGSKQ